MTLDRPVNYALVVGRVSDAKHRLLEAAIELVWRQSYGAVTVDAICERAGVKKGSFYHFFASKAELVAAALEHHWQKHKPEYDRMFSPAVAPLDRIRGYLEYVHRGQVTIATECGQVLGCPNMSVGSELTDQEKVVCEKVQELMGTMIRYIESALRDLAAAGQIAPVDLPCKARCLFSYVEGTITQARIHNDVELLATLRESGMRLLGLEPGAVAST